MSIEWRCQMIMFNTDNNNGPSTLGTWLADDESTNHLSPRVLDAIGAKATIRTLSLILHFPCGTSHTHTLTYCSKTRKPKMDKWFFIRSLFVWLNALIFAGRFHRMFSGWRKRQKVNVHSGNRWMFYGIDWKETRNKFPSIACTLYTYRLLAYGLYLFQFPTEIHRYVWDVIIVIVKWPFFLRFSIRCVGVYLLLICGSFWHIVTKWLARVRGIKTSWTTSHSVSESISMWRFAPSLIFISTFVTRNRQMN